MANEPTPVPAASAQGALSLDGGPLPVPALAPIVEAAASPPAAAPAPVVAVPAAAEPAPIAPAAAAPVPEVPKATAEKPTLLQKFDDDQKAKEPVAEPAKPDAKPAPTAEAKPEGEPKPVEPIKPEPIAYEYAVPETVKLDDAMKQEFHGALDAFRQDPPKGAQGLVDLHNKAMEQFASTLAADQRRLFGETRDGWAKDVMSDQQIGGAGHQTAMKAIARMRDRLVPKSMMEPRKFPDGSPRASEFDEFCSYTGAGDNKVFLRILHNAARYFDEPGLPPENPQPPPDNGRNPRQRGARVLYDNPRSSQNRN